MSIEVNIPPLLQTLADGNKRIDVSGGTVGECLEEMIERYPGLKGRLFTRGGKIAGGLNIYVNGEGVYPDALARPVKDGDKIHLAYLIFGG
jgi:molybdopterin converting factor small subunit